jgi:hypothetical protein
MALSFEALTTGGVIFVVAVAGGIVGKDAVGRALRWLICAATLLTIAQVSLASANSAILIGTTDLQPVEIAGADFWKAALLVVAGAVTIIILAAGRWCAAAAVIACLCILAGSTMMSHSVARLEYRWLLLTSRSIWGLACPIVAKILPFVRTWIAPRRAAGPATAAQTRRDCHAVAIVFGSVSQARSAPPAQPPSYGSRGDSRSAVARPAPPGHRGGGNASNRQLSRCSVDPAAFRHQAVRRTAAPGPRTRFAHEYGTLSARSRSFVLRRAAGPAAAVNGVGATAVRGHHCRRRSRRGRDPGPLP